VRRMVVVALAVIAVLAGASWLRSSSDAASPNGQKSSTAPDTSRIHLGPATAGTEAFVAWPAGKSPVSAIVVIHEWWGLNGQIRDVARRLTQQGYVAIVPDLYHGQVATDPETAHELSRGVDESVALADMDAAVAWLRSQPRIGTRRIGIVGFCMGGGLAQRMAIHSREIAAAVMFYGSPETDPAKLAALSAPLQAHFGAEDKGITADKVEALKAGLAKAGKPVEVYVYAGAGHAFMNDSRPSYHADAARQAWARTLAFFQKNLKG
jgi:carboxymethylenebutenolidase